MTIPLPADARPALHAPCSGCDRYLTISGHSGYRALAAAWRSRRWAADARV